MTRCGLVVLISILTSPGTPPAAESPEPTETTEEANPAPEAFVPRPRTPAQVGSLHRAAATLESVLDLYRLALVELVVASRRVREAGGTNTAKPTDSLPAPVAEVYQRLARTLRSRIPEGAMPPIARGYHAEALDALEGLAMADQLSQVPRPTRALVTAVREISATAHAVIDLFSRQRPILARVIDQDLIFEELSDALDEVAAAEEEIRTRRHQRAGQDAMAGAFRRTEIALGHLLDLWAAARQMGVDLTAGEPGPLVDMKIPPQISTATLTLITNRVEERLAELEEVLLTIEAGPPAIPAGMLDAELVPRGTKGGEAHLVWQAPPVSATRVAQIRIYRLDDRDATLERLIVMFRCQGKTPSEATTDAEAALADLDPAPLSVADLAPGRTRYTETLDNLPVTSPIYRVVPVSPFGVEGDGPEARAVFLPAEPDGARLVTAVLSPLLPTSPDFYWQADAVEVSWRLSDSDPERHGDTAAVYESLAAINELPLIATYAVERRAASGDERGAIIGVVPAGTDRFIDHPPLDRIREGIRYRVYAVTSGQQVGRTTTACEISESVQKDLSFDLALAAAGAGALKRPTDFERQMIRRFSDDALYDEAKLRFGQRAAAEQIWLRWWRSNPEAERAAWITGMIDMIPAADRDTWLNSWDLSLSARDQPLAKAEIFLASQPPQLRDEVARWWSLLDQESRQRAGQRWRDSLNDEHGRWLDARLQGDGGEHRGAEEPARVLAWWGSRGVLERARLETWWQAQDEEARTAAVRAWYGALPQPARVAVRWPDWDQRTKAEQRAALEQPPLFMPDPLFKRLLAWLAWEDLEGDQRLNAIRREVGWINATAASIKLSLRPLDKRAGFHLLFWFLFSILGSATLYCLVRSFLPKRS